MVRTTYLVSTDKKQQTHGLLNRLVGYGRCCERLNLTALLKRMVCLCHLLRLNSLLCTAEYNAVSMLNHVHPLPITCQLHTLVSLNCYEVSVAIYICTHQSNRVLKIAGLVCFVTES